MPFHVRYYLRVPRALAALVGIRVDPIEAGQLIDADSFLAFFRRDKVSEKLFIRQGYQSI